MELNLEEIRKVVRNSGYKSSWIARNIGVSGSTLSRFVNGKSNLSGSAMILLFQVLKLKPEAFVKKAS
jgi:plasmid maintenance system antidote protein VapI